MRKYVWSCVLPLVAATACVQSAKSSTPLSPSVAGPIAGVNISAPLPVDPSQNARIDTNSQPLTLVVQNASTNGVRPLTYVFEIASDAGFTNKVFTRDNIPQDGSGRTSVRLPDALAPERTYFWRARADDGANGGSFTNPVSFTVYTPVLFQPPTPIAPVDNVTTSSVKPTFKFANASRTGPVGPVSYLIELGDSVAFTNKVSATVAEQAGGTTSFDTPTSLPAGTQLFWHVRAFDPNFQGPFSATQVFTTPAAPTGGGGGGHGTGGHVSCGTLDVACAKAIVLGTGDEFPNLLVVFPSDSQADAAAVELLRRMIWHLQLAGFNAGRQRNPSGAISSDKLTIFIGGQWHAYDVFTLGFAGVAATVHFDEVTPPNNVPDGGIPD